MTNSPSIPPPPPSYIRLERGEMARMKKGKKVGIFSSIFMGDDGMGCPKQEKKGPSKS